MVDQIGSEGLGSTGSQFPVLLSLACRQSNSLPKRLTMESRWRSAGFCSCCNSPVVQVFHSTGRVSRAMASISSSSSFAAHKSMSCRFANSNFWKATEVSSTSKLVLARAPHNLCAVAGQSYYAERKSPYPRNTITTAQGAYDQYGQQDNEFPRPPLIQWEKDLANAVQLIGNVGRDVDIKYLDSGKVVARTSIAVKKGVQKDEEPSWFTMEFWDALAEIAAHHVKKGDQIFVTGKIVVDRWLKDDIQNTICKVVVRDLCFVEPYSGSRRAYGQSNATQDEQYLEMGPNSQSEAVATTGASQRTWNQQKSAKQSPQSASLASGITGQKGASKNFSEAALATEKRWLEYFADPAQWWDNRTNKKNPKAPDFKHKSTQEALWLNGWNNPSWVQQQMAVLEEKEAHHPGDTGDSHQRPKTKKLSSFQDSDFLY